MSAVKKPQPIAEDDYLAGELVATRKHEYVGGRVYAMTGGRVNHNRIATNILVAVGSRLRGKRCRAFNSDMKVRIPGPPKLRFYYPDASIVCQSNEGDSSYQERPVVIFEVVSRSTRRIDEDEKLEAYFSLPSLNVYAIVEQDSAKIAVHRRSGGGFNSELYEGLEVTLALPEVEVLLPLGEIYDLVNFSPEPIDEDESH